MMWGNSNEIKKGLRDEKEFSMVEMIIFVGILVVLVVIIEPNLQNFLSATKQAKADNSAEKLYTATIEYLNDNHNKGIYIETENHIWKRCCSGGRITENMQLRTIMVNYFKGGQIDADVSYEVHFDSYGDIKLVVWEEDGFKGMYQKSNAKK